MDEEESVYIDPTELAEDDGVENLKEGQLNPMQMLQMYANRKAQSIVKGNKDIAAAILAAAPPPRAPDRSETVPKQENWWEDLLREEASSVGTGANKDDAALTSDAGQRENSTSEEEHIYADLFSTGTENGPDSKLNEQPWYVSDTFRLSL